jgi:hypothetical protein
MALDAPLSAPGGWLDRRTAAAPDVLRLRLVEHVTRASAPGGEPALLAAAATAALERVVERPGDRSVALDLLAADGLITLALLRQSELDPGALAAFARGLTEQPTR